MKNRLGVFAKHWTPGQVKTRLAAIGIENASQVYFKVLRYLLSKLHNFSGQKSIVYAPVERRAEFSALAETDWSLVAQSGGGLGERLTSFFIEQFQNENDQAALQVRPARLQSRFESAAPELKLNYPNVVVIGSDCPAIDCELIEEAFRKLEKCSVVIGPSQDGGYYLIGLNQPHWELFQGIAWSTDRVFAQTMEVLQEFGVDFEVLPQLIDIDTPQDLSMFVQEWSLAELNLIDQQLLKDLKLLAGLE